VFGPVGHGPGLPEDAAGHDCDAVADAEQLAQLKALSPLQLLEAVAVRSEK
jgi:hypothetical protein